MPYFFIININFKERGFLFRCVPYNRNVSPNFKVWEEHLWEIETTIKKKGLIVT